MNLRFHIICVVCILTLTGPVTAVQDSTATVHGVTYRWDTIEPLDSTVVEINSTPPQSMVAKRGEYSFELGPGEYNITARYYQDGVLTYSTEETFKIEEGGTYVYDLLLLPVSSEGNISSVNINETPEDSSSNKTPSVIENSTQEGSDRNNSNVTYTPEKIWIFPSTANYLLITFMLFLLLVGGYGLFRNHKAQAKNTLQKENTENKEGSFLKLLKTKGLSTKALSKNVSPKIEQASRTNTEGTVSVNEPELKTSEKKASDSNVIKNELPAESREYSAKKIGFTESDLAEESKKTSLEDSSETPENEDSASKKGLPLSADLQEVVDVIRGHGGRITQKDLRSRLKYSEVKVSLLLSELEKRDLIKKLKRGRENIVVLREEKL